VQKSNEFEIKYNFKLLLMGRKAAGKTSMHSIIFANYPGIKFLIFRTNFME